MKREMLLIVLFEMVILSSFVYGFDISTPGDAQVGTPSFDLGWDIDFTVGGILGWTYQLIADFFGVPMEDMKIRGGNLFAFVLVPILLAYMMFYAIIVKTALFDATPGVEKWIPLLLALILAPLGIYRRFFFAVTAFFTTGTATLLYIFLFVLLLGWGYKNMFARGVGDFTAGNFHMADMKGAKKDVKDLHKRIQELQRRIDTLRDKKMNFVKGLDKDQIDKLGDKVDKIDDEIDSLVKERESLEAYVKERRDNLHGSFKHIINPSR